MKSMLLCNEVPKCVFYSKGFLKIHRYPNTPIEFVYKNPELLIYISNSIKTKREVNQIKR